MKEKKFIVVQDKAVANQLQNSGFQMVAATNGIYTFMNIIPQHFNFSDVDATKIVYTDILSI